MALHPHKHLCCERAKKILWRNVPGMTINSDFYAQVEELVSTRTSFVLVTLVDVVLSAPQEIGAKMIVTHDGLQMGSVGGGKLEAAALNKALEILRSEDQGPGTTTRPRLLTWNLKKDLGMTCGGEATLFFDVHNFQRWKIAIFGAGHVSQALVPLLLTLECQLTVIDERADWLAKLPTHSKLKKVCISPLTTYVDQLDPDSFIISITPGHSFDLPLVETILRKMKPPYIGVIGSSSKSVVLKRELKLRGIEKHLIDALYCPIGLPFGTRDPQEIAISFTAQLLQVRYERLALKTPINSYSDQT